MYFNIFNSCYQEDLSTVASLDFINWSKLENKAILITGATGLICSFLIDVLMFRNMHYKSNISIYGISRSTKYAKSRFNIYWDNPLFQFINQDISEKIKIDKEFNFIIHGASNAYPASYASDPVGTMKANLLGIFNILDYSINKPPYRILYISSGEVYGEGVGEDFIESYSGYIDYLNPRSCYPSSKRAAETLCVSYSSQYNIDTVIARPCHIYGPTITDTDNRAFAQFIRNVLEKKDIILKSTGEQYRSYCYVADCVSALLVILLKGVDRNAYNIANKDSNVSIMELANTIANFAGQEVMFDMPSTEEKKGYSVFSKAVLNSDKLTSLGWKAKYSLSDGIKQTVQILSSQE
jgi:nucleoside-diphosphate-sugar epimerase